VAVLVAIGVNREGFREVLAVAEVTTEDAESWRSFLRHLKERGLAGVELFASDKCLRLVEALGEFYLESAWQQCMVHFYRNVFSVVPAGKVKVAAAMLKAIHAQEDRASAGERARAVAEKLEGMKLGKAAQIVREGIAENMAFPPEHWRSLRTNNPLERINREIGGGPASSAPSRTASRR
jgi:transposase-like protein